MKERLIFLFTMAVQSVMVNKLRGILTALGVVFGVAAVIAMLAIGSGAKKFILDQMRLIGTNNIVFTHKSPDQGGGSEEAEETDAAATSAGNDNQLKPWAPGMSKADVDVIRTIPSVELVSPEIIRKTKAIFNGKILDIRCVGVTNSFFELNQLTVARGTMFTEEHLRNALPVCIIGKNIEAKLFSGQDPLGQAIKCGNNYFTIVGVLEKRLAERETLQSLGLRDLNADVFIPLDVSLIRFGDRSRISREHLGRQGRDEDESDMQQIDRLVVRVHDSKYLQPTAEVVSKLLKRRHDGNVDFEMEIPELLLQQEQKTQDIFNLVLAVIAGISLLVGGIGIMNIMLASVYERIREIGLRRALGATENDITFQFLIEAVLVSTIGGLIGVFLGIAAARAISTAAEIPTIISWWSIVLSFGVAASIGLAFGIFPAQKAAKLDPIEALRTD